MSNSVGKGWRFVCPRDVGDGRHVSVTFYFPEMSPAQTTARWEGVNASFGTCPCGSETVPSNVAGGPTLDDVNAAWEKAGRDVSGRRQHPARARAYYEGVVQQARAQSGAPKGAYREHTPEERKALTTTRRWLATLPPANAGER